MRLGHAETDPPLADQVQAALAPLLRQEKEGTLWECFHRGGQPRAAPVLVFDQFEEIFTLGRETVARRHRSAEFFDQLADLIQNNCPAQVQERFDREREAMRAYDFDRQDFKVVISMREEYLAFLEESRQPLRRLMPQRLRLIEMTGTQALEAITKAGGHLLDAGVGESIVRFVAGADSQGDAQTAKLDDIEVAPALLSLVCSELNDNRRQTGAATISERLLLGRRDQILRDFYERCFAGLDAGVRVFVEEQLLTTSGYRNSMAVEDAVRTKKASEEVIDTLVERRLLRIDRLAGTARIEITHDILIGPCKLSRDLRHLRERGWWSKVLAASGYVEVFYALGVISPWYVYFVLSFFLGITRLDSSVVVPKMIADIALITVWYIALYLGLRRWTWVVRVIIQAFLFVLGVGVIIVEMGMSRFNVPERIGLSLCTSYYFLLPTALALLHLMMVRRAVFARSRKPNPPGTAVSSSGA